MNFNELITDFAKKIDLKDTFAPNHDGAYSFVVDSFEVKCLPLGSKHFLLKGKVCSLSEDDYEASRLVKKLLTANLAIAKESDEVLAQENEDIVLFRRIDADTVNSEEFTQFFETFVNKMELLRNCSQETVFVASPFQMIFP